MAALLRPSSAPMWGNCSGSVMANLGAPDFDTEQKREGHAAHWCVEDTLRNGGNCIDRLGKQAPNGTVIDDDMVECGQIYVDDVRAVLAQYGGELHIELPVTMHGIHPENRGTLDGQVTVLTAQRLFLWDFKYGRRRVDARGNLQLIDYAFGLREKLNIDGHAEQHIRIDIRVVQPRCSKPSGPIDTWSVMLAELRPYWNQLTRKAHEATSAQPKFSAGPWCRDCAAIVRCDTAAMFSYSVFHYVDQPYQINTLTDRQAATELRNMQDAEDVIKARKEALEEEVKHRVKSGKNCGLVLQTTKGRRKWSAGNEVIIATFTQLGVKAVKETPLTPKQMLDAMPADKKETAAMIIKQLSTCPAGETLVDEKDCLTSRIFKN